MGQDAGAAIAAIAAAAVAAADIYSCLKEGDNDKHKHPDDDSVTDSLDLSSTRD